MFCTKSFVILSVLVAISHGKLLKLINSHSTGLVVTAGGTENTLVANGVTTLNLEDGWSGSITAIPIDAEVTDGPKTKVDLSLDTISGDNYGISLLEGFNLRAKVIPGGSASCTSVVCTASILNLCPLANQVTNSSGTIVACQNSPTIMSNVCPQAAVDAATAAVNVQSCADATQYVVIFI